MASGRDLVPVGSSGPRCMTTTKAPVDVGKTKFKVILKGVDDVTKETTQDDVTVSCPPENKGGFFVVSLYDILRVQKGPGFPNVELEHHSPKIEVDHKKKWITITLHKEVPGTWAKIWADLPDLV